MRMLKTITRVAAAALPAGALLLALPVATTAQAQGADCPVSRDRLVQALKDLVKASGGKDNGGLPVNEWAAVVDRTGHVCAIGFSGGKPTDQWLGSRAIAIEKANTVISFSLDEFAISTANLWAQSQPGGYLYGTNLSNPPLEDKLFAGEVSQWGTKSDPVLGKFVGGVIVYGGGLALYDDSGLVGGLGASGNTSCADHNIAWRLREQLKLDKVPGGPSPDNNDEIIYDVGADGKSKTGWGHTTCGRNAPQVAQAIGAGIVMLPRETHASANGVPESTPSSTPTMPLDTTPPQKQGKQ